MTHVLVEHQPPARLAGANLFLESLCTLLQADRRPQIWDEPKNVLMNMFGKSHDCFSIQGRLVTRPNSVRDAPQ